MTKSFKDDFIKFRISKEMKDDFLSKCHHNHEVPSQVLVDAVREYIQLWEPVEFFEKAKSGKTMSKASQKILDELFKYDD